MADLNLADQPPVAAPAAKRDALVLAGAGRPVAGASAAPPVAAREAARQATLIARRALDLVLATVALLLLLVLLVVIAVLIKLDTPGPILFRQRRLGKDMRPFTVLKFRTMRTDATSDAHMRYIAEAARSADGRDGSTLKKLTDDPRVTRVGRTLRRLSIDEIPQLFNVIAGQMALVGPRPAIEYELEHYEPAHFERFNVRPGITGLWQVSGRSTLGFKDMLDLDAAYATHATFATDVRILVRTPAAAVRNAA
jgi:lipopolysaccharide/colanic/teichoic acid biosynthesis glycosyltransferase